MRLSEVRAIITGAAGALGSEFVRQLLVAGAAIAACDIDASGLDRLRVALDPYSDRLTTYVCDVRQEEAVVDFVNKAATQLRTPNLVVNNAGILRDGLLAKEESGWIRTLPTAQWQTVLDVNLTGPFLIAREAVKSMITTPGAAALIVNVSSITRVGNRGQSNYSASKAGLDALTRTWSLELAEYGIRVASIAPGFVDTPMLKRMDPEVLEAVMSTIPAQRLGTANEIWLALRFVIECDYFTGRILEVDGGIQM